MEWKEDGTRELFIVDTFGTADEDRWWDEEALKKGDRVDVSKEIVRQHYRGTGYHEELYSARDAGQPDPPIPPLPDEVVERTSKLYSTFYERVTGEDF